MPPPASPPRPLQIPSAAFSISPILSPFLSRSVFPSLTPERRVVGGVEEVLTASFAAPQGTSKPVFVAYAGEKQRGETRGQLLKSATCISAINIQRGFSVTPHL